MQDRWAFTAKPWGNAAVVYRAMEDYPGPIVDQEFGMLGTWTQTHTFATRLNEGLELDPLQVCRIITARSIAPAIFKNRNGSGGLSETFPLPEDSMFVSGGQKSDNHDGQ
jgi:hypothetical protein